MDAAAAAATTNTQQPTNTKKKTKNKRNSEKPKLELHFHLGWLHTAFTQSEAVGISQIWKNMLEPWDQQN